jgi:hypothetical protein
MRFFKLYKLESRSRFFTKKPYTGCSILFRVLFSQFISATWNEYGHVTYIFKENLKGNSMQKKFAEKHNPY